MDGLPGHLLDEILFRIDPRSLANSRCTNRSLRSHMRDPYFESEYFSRVVGSGLLHISSYGSNMLCYLPHSGSRSPRSTHTKLICRILGSCSGLLLLFIKKEGEDGLCVANPFTKKFRFLNLSSRIKLFSLAAKYIGFAVDQIDRTTQRFKVVHMTELEKASETKYRFEINAGDSWRYSKSTITCSSSNLDDRMKTPVYLDGSLHWLRDDGSVLAFDPETEQARLIPAKFPEGLSPKRIFAAGDGSLTLVSATGEVIYIYALENVLGDPKWVLVRRIQSGAVDENEHFRWTVEAYDGKCLVLSAGTWEGYGVAHVYDLSANKWAVMGLMPGWCDANRDSFQITPSLSSVVGLDERLARDADCISSLSSIMGLIDGTSTKDVEKQLDKYRLKETATEKNLALLKKLKHSSRFLRRQIPNKRRRQA